MKPNSTGNEDTSIIYTVSMEVTPGNTSWPWELKLTFFVITFFLSSQSKFPFGKHSFYTLGFYLSILIFGLMNRKKSTSVY